MNNILFGWLKEFTELPTSIRTTELAIAALGLAFGKLFIPVGVLMALELLRNIEKMKSARLVGEVDREAIEGMPPLRRAAIAMMELLGADPRQFATKGGAGGQPTGREWSIFDNPEQSASFSDRFLFGAAEGVPLPRPRPRLGFGSGISSIAQVLAAQGYRITSTTGGTHAGREHGEGRAIDFVPPGGVTDIPSHVSLLRKKLKMLGLDARIIDASTPDSSAWTGPHIHMDFPSPEAEGAFLSKWSGQRLGAGGDRTINQTNNTTINIHGEGNRDLAQKIGDHQVDVATRLMRYAAGATV